MFDWLFSAALFIPPKRNLLEGCWRLVLQERLMWDAKVEEGKQLT